MTASTAHARPDQVDELTRHVRLPVPAIPDVHMQVLAEGLRHAFDDLRARRPETMVSGDEPEVTALMEARLNRLLDEKVVWTGLVIAVARGRESSSFDGSHLEKRPDLSIYLSNRTRSFPLVVEAKIVDAATAKTVASYCEHGLRRFVEGEYAWAHHEALMLGYVRDGSSIDAALKPFLERAMVPSPSTYLVEELPVHVGSGVPDLARTRHGREFEYVGQDPPNSPGPIAIWHVWLS